MNWYIGQEVICIKSHSDGFIKRGQTFKIKGLSLPICTCNYILIDIGHRDDLKLLSSCPECNGYSTGKTEIRYYHEELFAPLDGDISELVKIIEEHIVEPITINQ